MMVLLFRLGEDRYAVDVKDVVEIVPNVPLQQIPLAPEFVSGLLNYRGVVVPIIDLSLLITKERSRKFLSSRVVMVRWGEGRFLGLLAEHVTEAMKVDETTFARHAISQDCGTFVNGVALDEQGMIQRIDINAILPAEIKGILDHCAEFNSDSGSERVIAGDD